MLTIALAVTTSLLAAVLVIGRLQLVCARERLIECRIALEFIRDEHADMPHEFAAIWISGNHQAMEQKFPDFFIYRNACLSCPDPEYAQ